MYLSLIQERREEKESGRVVLAKQWMWVSVCVSLLRYAQYLSFFLSNTNKHTLFSFLCHSPLCKFSVSLSLYDMRLGSGGPSLMFSVVFDEY